VDDGLLMNGAGEVSTARLVQVWHFQRVILRCQRYLLDMLESASCSHAFSTWPYKKPPLCGTLQFVLCIATAGDYLNPASTGAVSSSLVYASIAPQQEQEQLLQQQAQELLKQQAQQFLQEHQQQQAGAAALIPASARLPVNGYRADNRTDQHMPAVLHHGGIASSLCPTNCNNSAMTGLTTSSLLQKHIGHSTCSRDGKWVMKLCFEVNQLWCCSMWV
jgi:hypothetical protein